MTNKIVEGVGQDAEIVTNEIGGKESKSPLSLHLFDPRALYYLLEYPAEFNSTVLAITSYMRGEDKVNLINAINFLGIQCRIDPIAKISEVLEYGANRYEVNNWRLIPQESHLNHALIHLYAYGKGDTQDDHIGHCMCRLMMAFATECSDGFSYNQYINKEEK